MKFRPCPDCGRLLRPDKTVPDGKPVWSCNNCQLTTNKRAKSIEELQLEE